MAQDVAINLAALSAMSGNVDHARQLLHLATQYGDSGATAYAATLDPDQLIRAEALQRLGSMIEDSDAMNFLGIAAHSRGMRRGSTGLDPPRLVTWSHRFYCTHDEIRPTSPAATDHTDLHNG